jgi:alpha-galactosidase
MGATKIVFVGGGSFHWGPEIIRDLIVTTELAGATLVLHDLDHEAAEHNRAIGERLKEASAADFTITVEDDRRAALDGASYVIVAIATGGLEAWRLDMEIPDEHGVRQTIADTVGPGGWSRGLRTIPVLVDIARDMEEVCPSAWMLNVTNPMTTLTRAVHNVTSIPCVGLCHEMVHQLPQLEPILGAQPSEMAFRAAGINHCSWMFEILVRGQDGLQMIREHWRTKGLPKDTVAPTLLEIYGTFPVGKGRHLSEFFPHFLTPETGYGEKYGFLDQTVTVEDRYASRKASRDRWLLMAEGKHLPALERGDEPIAEIIVALEGGPPTVVPVNWPNEGQVSNLPSEVVVETMGMIDHRGVSPVCAGELPRGVLGVLGQHIDNQELIVEAALWGDRELAFQALFNDPLVRDIGAARAIFDELLEAHERYLPHFFT